jgi:hypothetical protein
MKQDKYIEKLKDHLVEHYIETGMTPYSYLWIIGERCFHNFTTYGLPFEESIDQWKEGISKDPNIKRGLKLLWEAVLADLGEYYLLHKDELPQKKMEA